MRLTRDIAWAAGLFEGEGCITKSGTRPRLSLKMIDPEPVRRFAEIMGGKVYGPYENDSGKRDGYERRDFFLWVGDGETGRRAFEAMRSLLSAARCARFDEVYLSRENAEGDHAA